MERAGPHRYSLAAPRSINQCKAVALISAARRNLEIHCDIANVSRASTKHASGVSKASKNVPPERSLASVNVRASCSGEVSQRQAGSRLGG